MSPRKNANVNVKNRKSHARTPYTHDEKFAEKNKTNDKKKKLSVSITSQLSHGGKVEVVVGDKYSYVIKSKVWNELRK